MKWFKHDSDASYDAKLQNVILDYGLEGYGLYWHCLELISGNVSSKNIDFSLEHDARIIAKNVNSTEKRVEEMMRYFIKLGLFEYDAGGRVTCLKLARRLDKSMTNSTEMRRVIDMLSPPKETQEGFVYFIEKVDADGRVNSVKIGHTRNPSARLAELVKHKDSTGFTVRIAHKYESENCPEDVANLQSELVEFCISGDWYKPVSEVIGKYNPSYVMTYQNYVMLEVEVDKDKDKEKTPLTPLAGGDEESAHEDKLTKDAKKSLERFNSATGSRCRKWDEFIKPLKTGFSLEEVIMVIDWVVETQACGPSPTPSNICRITKFDDKLSRAIKYSEGERSYRSVIASYNDTLGSVLVQSSEIVTARLMGLIDALTRHLEPKGKTIQQYFEYVAELIEEGKLDWMTGDKGEFKANIEYILKLETFKMVIEK